MPQRNPPAPPPENAPARSAAEATERPLRDRQLCAALLSDTWLAVLSALEARARREDRRRRGLLGLAVAGVLVSFVLLLVEQPTAALPVLLVAVGLFLGCLRRRGLANHLRRFVVPLLRVFQEDLDPQAPLLLALRWQDRDAPDNLVASQGGQKHFRNPLAGHGRLRDGALVDWQLCDESRCWTATRHASSGKSKHQTKHRVRTQVEVRLSVPRDRDELRPTPGVSVGCGTRRDVVTVKQTCKYKDRDGAVTLREFFGVLARAFRSVALRAQEARP